MTLLGVSHPRSNYVLTTHYYNRVINTLNNIYSCILTRPQSFITMDTQLQVANNFQCYTAHSEQHPMAQCQMLLVGHQSVNCP